MESIRKALGLFVLGGVLTLAAAPVLAQISTTPVPPASNGVSPIDGPDRPDHDHNGPENNGQ